MKMWGWKIQLIMSVHPQTPPSVWRGGYHSPHIQVTLPCYILTIQTSKLAKRINPSSLLCGMWFSSNSKQGKLLINDFKLLCCFQHSLIMIRPIQCCCWCLTMASSHTVPAWGTPRHWLWEWRTMAPGSVRRHYLVVPRHSLGKYKCLAFAVASPTAWISLSDDLCDPTLSNDSFRCLLKTWLFSEWERERESRFLTTHQHILGYTVFSEY